MSKPFPKLHVGQRVKLSAAGWSRRIVDSPEAAEQAREMRIVRMEVMGYDNGRPFHAIDVDAPLINRFMLSDGDFEPLADPTRGDQGHAIVLTSEGPVFRWTKPFHGVTHLLGLPANLRVTVSEYDSGSAVRLVNMNTAAFSTQRGAWFSTVELAKEEGEKWARELMAK